jgi:anaerobic magnesium-protoporphyrin IX monomethyl ester cyclase
MNMAQGNEQAQIELRKSNNKIKVVLIYPPKIGGVKTPFYRIGADSEDEGAGHKAPIGLLYVATTVKKYTEHEILFIDCAAEDKSIEETVKVVEKFQPDLVGISAWTNYWYSAFSIGKLIKERLPHVHLTYGGPHIGIYIKETLSIPFVDSVIAGDGEFPFAHLCNMVADKQFNNHIDGLHLKQYGPKEGSEAFSILKNLDLVPIPDRSFIKEELYTSVVAHDKNVATMITSRGCPFACIFCKLHFQKTVCRSAENVVEELKQLNKIGYKEIDIYDDTFTWSKERVIKICEGIIKEGINIEWAIRDRVTNADKEMLLLMRKAGLKRIHYGIESGVDAILKRINKKITTHEARRAVQLAKEAGLQVMTFFMIGLIDESYEDMKKTVDFAMELKSDYSTFNITVPWPGTQLYKQALESGIIPYDYWLQYAIEPAKDFVIVRFIENKVDLKTMIELQTNAIRRFYFKPSYLFKELLKVQSAGEFIKRAKVGLNLLRGHILSR